MNDLTVSRRSFIGGTLAAMGGLALAGTGLANVEQAKAAEGGTHHRRHAPIRSTNYSTRWAAAPL